VSVKVKVYLDGDGTPEGNVLANYYEQYKSERGTAGHAGMEAICFARFLLEHLTEFQAELAILAEIEKKTCPACGKPGSEHSYTQRVACLEKQSKEAS
jgi:hypothetical protein